MIKKYSQLKEKGYHVTLLSNVDFILRDGLLPKIGERSEVFGESKPAVYLFKTELDAENALMNWLGDEFEENDDEKFVLLEVVIPEGIQKEEEGFEIRVFGKIPPENISVESWDF